MTEKPGLNGPKPSPSSTRRSRGVRAFLTWRRVLDGFLILAVACLAGYLAVFAFKVGSGYSQTRTAPEHTARVQIINASGDRDLVAGVKARLAELSDQELSVEIAEVTWFDLRQVPRTVIVSRESDCEHARTLAARLGLDADEVNYEPLEHNTEYVTASLILGQDARERLLDDPLNKEKT